MARPPLAAFAVLLLSAPGATQDLPAHPTEHPVYEAFRRELAAAFMEKPDQPLPDLARRRPEAAAAGVEREFDELMIAAERARFVQLGRAPGDTVAVYRDMVRFAARSLGVPRPESAVPLYANKVRPANAPGGGPGELALRAAILRAMAPSLAPERAAIVRRSAEETSRRLEALIRREAGETHAAFASNAPAAHAAAPALADAPAAPLTPEELASLPPRVQSPALRTAEPAPLAREPPPPTGIAWAWSSVMSYLDASKAAEMAQAAQKAAVGFLGRCYEYFKKGLIWAGVLPDHVRRPNEIGEVGIGSGSAYMFARDLNRDPRKLERLNLRRVDASTIEWAPANDNLEGLILVWNRGCNGFNAEHGHIELIVSRRRIPDFTPAMQRYVNARLRPADMLACSDGCTGRAISTLRAYGRRPECLSVYAPVDVAP